MWSILSAIISFLGVLYIFYKTREFQMNMHKDRLEEDAKNNQPAFVFQPLEIYYEFKGYNKNYIKKNWIYKDSDSYNDNVLNDFKNDYFYKSFLRFRNIGNGIAKNVTITYSHIDALKYLNQVNGVSYYPLNHKFQFIKEDRKYGIAYISGEPEKGTYRFKVNSNKKYSIKKFRFINNKDYFELPFNLSDMYIFNYRIYHLSPYEIKEPMIKLTFEYYDLYDNYYNEDIFISIQNVSMKYDFDNKIKIKSRLDEINKDFIVEANRNTQEQHGHDKYFN